MWYEVSGSPGDRPPTRRGKSPATRDYRLRDYRLRSAPLSYQSEALGVTRDSRSCASTTSRDPTMSAPAATSCSSYTPGPSAVPSPSAACSPSAVPRYDARHCCRSVIRSFRLNVCLHTPRAPRRSGGPLRICLRAPRSSLPPQDNFSGTSSPSMAQISFRYGSHQERDIVIFQ